MPVQRLGSRFVNFYVVETDEGIVVVDGGVPGYWPQLEQELGGKRADAMVLTHAHADHVGVANRVREQGAAVHVHEEDGTLARTAKQFGKRDASLLPYLRHPAAWRLFWELGRNGGMKPQKIERVTTFAGGATLDVPGKPRVIHTPGHSDGHVALLFESEGALFVGDALCTYNPLTGATGPQLMPSAFNNSTQQALESLARLEELHAERVYFGHGEPWLQGPRLAVERARTVGRT